MNRRRVPHREDWLCRIYAAALHLYLRSHRAQWGAAMRQTFRDHYRAITRQGRDPRRWLLTVALPDVIVSSTRERVTALLQLIQEKPMHPSITRALAFTLTCVGAALLALSAIALGFSIHDGRFTHPGGFDALTAFQLMWGVAGGALLAIGARQRQPAMAARSA